MEIEVNKNKPDRTMWNNQGKALTRYIVFQFAASIVLMLVYLIFKAIQQGTMDILVDEMVNDERVMGMTSILIAVLGTLLVWRWCKKKEMNLEIFEDRKAMTVKGFFIFYCCLMIPQIISSVCAAGMEEVLNYFGYTMSSDLEWMYGGSTSISMLIYCILVGPIAEEILFRGIFLKNNERYGRVFAIVFSSVLFGVFHANFIQGAFAFLVGIIFAYIAMEYSIKWAIILHVMNNTMSEVLSYLANSVEESIGGTIISIINIGMCIFAVAMIFIKREEIKQYCRENLSEKGIWKHAITAIWIIIFIGINICMAVGNIAAI